MIRDDGRSGPLATGLRIGLVSAVLAVGTLPLSTGKAVAQSADTALPTESAADTARVGALPVIEAPALQPGQLLAFFIGGDGGWGYFARRTSDLLARAGIPVIGLNPRKYMRRPTSPDSVAEDAGRIIRAYMERWNRTGIVLVGYSRGADWMPFIANRLPADLRARVRLLALMAPSVGAGFSFHILDLVEDKGHSTDLPLLPEIEQLEGMPILCVYGRGEKRSLCPLAPADVDVVAHPGGHRTRDYELFSQLILQMVQSTV